jgi:hypothetical protein
MPVDNHRWPPRRDPAVAPATFPLMLAAKCPEKFAGKYRQTYPEPGARLRWHAYLHLNSDLCLDLSSRLYSELNPEKFEKSF